jgi:hypothetical protein
LPGREGFVERPPEQGVGPCCGLPLLPLGDTEDSEPIEIEVSAYRRVIPRRRYRRTCTCDGPITLTAPPPPKLIPKGRSGISVGVEILLDKYFSSRPTERLLASLRLWGLDRAPGTGHRQRRLEATGDPAAADRRGAEGAELRGGSAPGR